jgi:uncharacterized membrane protein (UPF0127 family)
MKKLVVVAPDGRVICELCHLADKPHTRLRGVMGWNHLKRGEGMLLKPTFSIHTSFVRFPIDAVFLDDEMTVLSIAQELKPWRLAWTRRARSVLELAAGECRRIGVKPGDRLGWGLI